MALSVTSIFLFFSQVKSEVLKVVWPSKSEMIVSTIIVVVFSIIAMFFFFFVDHLVAYGVEKLLNMGL